MPFLKQHLEKPDEEDAANTHLFAEHHRRTITREYHGEAREMFQEEWGKLVDGPGLNIALRHFIDDKRNAVDGFGLILFLVKVTLYVEETEQADVTRAQKLLNEHGEQDAPYLASAQGSCVNRIYSQGFYRR